MLGVRYGDNIDKVKNVLRDVVTGFPEVHPEPPMQIAVSEMADSSVNFVVRPWTSPELYWYVRFGLTEAIKNISIKRELHYRFRSGMCMCITCY